jgi:hypothetical protein
MGFRLHPPCGTLRFPAARLRPARRAGGVQDRRGRYLDDYSLVGWCPASDAYAVRAVEPDAYPSPVADPVPGAKSRHAADCRGASVLLWIRHPGTHGSRTWGSGFRRGSGTWRHSPPERPQPVEARPERGSTRMTWLRQRILPASSQACWRSCSAATGRWATRPVRARLTMGDVDCNDADEAFDRTQVQRHALGWPVQQAEPCANIGDTLPD